MNVIYSLHFLGRYESLNIMIYWTGVLLAPALFFSKSGMHILGKHSEITFTETNYINGWYECNIFFALFRSIWKNKYHVYVIWQYKEVNTKWLFHGG